MIQENIRKLTSTSPTSSSFKPVNEVFTQNVLRSHFQCAIWLSLFDPYPPIMFKILSGYMKDKTNGSLVVVMLPPNVMVCRCRTNELFSKGCYS